MLGMLYHNQVFSITRKGKGSEFACISTVHKLFTSTDHCFIHLQWTDIFVICFLLSKYFELCKYLFSFSVKGPELINMYVGQSEANVREGSYYTNKQILFLLSSIS